MKSIKKSLIFSLLALLCLPATANVKRESRHILSGELGVGYSSLLTKSDWGKPSGLVGANLQAAYEWQYRKFILHAGVELSSINSLTKVAPFTLDAPYTEGLSYPMTEHFAFSSYKEMACLGQFNIPIMAGGLFDDRYYFLVGTKIGFPIWHTSSLQADVKTTLTDPSLMGVLGQNQEIPAHDAYSSTQKNSSSFTSAMPNVQASAEVGVLLNSFFAKPKGKSNKYDKNAPLPRFYRIALFCDYGITSCGKPMNPDLATVSAPRDIALNPFVGTSSRLNSLLVGVKVAAQLQMNRPKPITTPPTYLDIKAVDALTRQPLTVSLAIRDEKTHRVISGKANNGSYHTKTKVGSFMVIASAANYFSDSATFVVTRPEDHQRLNFALRPLPVFTFRVKDAKSDSALIAPVEFINVRTEQVVATITSSAVGLDTIRLPYGESYRVHIEIPNHFSYTAPIKNIGGSEVFSIEPIIKKRAIILHNLFFATNQTTILPQSEAGLQDLYDLLKENADLRIRIVGHTDNVGSDRDNQILSEGRANSVRNEMINRGIDPSRIEAVGKGKTQPIDTNDTEEGRANNRRVEFIIL